MIAPDMQYTITPRALKKYGAYMLTRLKIKGFKNLFDCEIAFGPFTCIAGANASGKSNLFDAITFLRDLANYSIVEAASRVRDPSGSRKGDLRSIFTVFPDGHTEEIDLEAEFLVQKSVIDDFGRTATPSSTHLKYRVVLRYAPPEKSSPERLELIHESLTYIPKNVSRKRLGFKTTHDFWNSIIGTSRRADFISTEVTEQGNIIRLSQEGHQGRPQAILASNSPRTILGSINTDDKPTALAARREMQAWRLLQLEPSKLRLPDDFSDDSKVTPEGAHLPGALMRLEKYAEVANKLSTLLPDILSVGVDIDEGRRLKTLTITHRDGTRHTARSLSDGTLRFLALSIIGADTNSGGLICLEEPENGIHPSRVETMIELLQSTATDPNYAVGEDNPLRQIVINTHSPLVVNELDVNDLLVSLPIKTRGTTTTVFAPIPQTWRAREGTAQTPTVPLGSLLNLLNKKELPEESKPSSAKDKMTVIDYVTGQMSLF